MFTSNDKKLSSRHSKRLHTCQKKTTTINHLYPTRALNHPLYNNPSCRPGRNRSRYASFYDMNLQTCPTTRYYPTGKILCTFADLKSLSKSHDRISIILYKVYIYTLNICIIWLFSQTGNRIFY